MTIHRQDEATLLIVVYAGLGLAIISQKKAARRARAIRRWWGY